MAFWADIWMGVHLFVCPDVCWYIQMSAQLCLPGLPYVHVSISTFVHLSLHLYIHWYINAYLQGIVSFHPCHFAQVLTLPDWVPWLTGGVVAFVTGWTLECLDMPNDVFVIIIYRAIPVVICTLAPLGERMILPLGECHLSIY